jgi:AraC-like DNA-binding protein
MQKYLSLQEILPLKIPHLIETFRLEKAIDLIGEGEKIYLIADKVGYGSYLSFRFAFNKRVGISPHKFKESLDNKLNESNELINKTKKKLWID